MSDNERLAITIGAMIAAPIIATILIDWLRNRGYY